MYIMNRYQNEFHTITANDSNKVEVKNAIEEIIEVVKNRLEQQYPTNIPCLYLAQFKAIKNWFKRYTSNSDYTAIEKVRGYLEALHHICNLKIKEAAKLNLYIPVSINSSTDTLVVSLQDYLLYKGLTAELFEVIKEINFIINNFEVEDYDILILEGKALSWSGSLGKACYIFEQVAAKLPQDSPLAIEATARLGIDQIRAGKYDSGLINIRLSMKILKNQDKNVLKTYFLGIKTDLIESLAFYNMMKCNFNKAFELYSTVVAIRKENKFFHKLSYPVGHQGIVTRKLYTHPLSFSHIVLTKIFSYKLNITDILSGKLLNLILKEGYDKSISYLKEAKSIAIENQGETAWLDHHLAISFLCKREISLAEDYNIAALNENKIKNFDKGIADCLDLMGFIYLYKNEADRAYSSFREALSIREATQSIHGIVNSQLNLSIVEWNKRNYLKAAQELFLSFYRYNKIGLLAPARVLRILTLFWMWTLGKRNWLM